MDNMREELRVELSALGPRGRGRAYPKGLLEKLLSYTVARRRQGASIVEVGSEVGINFRTLARWLGERKAASFGRVEVVAARAATAAAAAPTMIVVHGPRGLRIEGLDLTAVAELVRRVGE
jgi:transposase